MAVRFGVQGTYVSGGRVILGVGVGGEGAKDFEAAQLCAESGDQS